MDIRSFWCFFIVFSFFTFYSNAQEDSSYVRSDRNSSVPRKKFKDQSSGTKKFLDKEDFFVGFYPGFQFSNINFFLEFSPIVGYEILPKLNVGVGGIYRYFRQRPTYQALSITSHAYGGRVFGSFDVYQGFLAHAEYEGITYTFDESFQGRMSYWRGAFKAGGGYSSPLGERASANLLVLYDFSFNENQFLGNSPLDIRVGFIFYPFRSKGD